MKVQDLEMAEKGVAGKSFTMTDMIINFCDQQGFNTVFDDDDSVVMQNSRYYVVLTTRPDGRIEYAYYRR
jgi:hypothetical protein